MSSGRFFINPSLDSTPYRSGQSKAPLEPRAPQGPSDEELNRITLDPILPPYGGSASLFSDLVAGRLMDPGRATSIIVVGDMKTRPPIGIQNVRNRY